MARPPSTYDGRTTTGKPTRAATSRASAFDVAVPLAGCGMPRSHSNWLNRWRSSARSIESGEVPRMVTPGFLQRQRQLQRGLAAELHDARHVDVAFALALDHRHHVFERQRLEVEAVGGVVVGRHGFRVAVDHHRLEAFGLEAEHGVTAAVIELDALADAVGAAAEDDDLLPVGRLGLARVLKAAVEIRRKRLELRRAGVDALERGPELQLLPLLAHGASRPRPGCRPARGRRTRRA